MSQATGDVRSLGDLESEGILEQIDKEDIDHLSCERCDHEWESEKHPADLSRPGCPRNECGHQSKYDINVHADVDYDAFGNPESDPLGGDGGDGGDDDADLDFSSAFESESEAQLGVSFTDMDPGEFIEWFFHEDLQSVSVNSLELLSRRCRRRHQLPTQIQMESFLTELKGAGQNNEQRKWIAEEYWARAKTYLAEHLNAREADIERMVYQSGSEWVRIPRNDGRGQMGQQPGQMGQQGMGQQPGRNGQGGGVLDMSNPQQPQQTQPGQNGMGNGQGYAPGQQQNPYQNGQQQNQQNQQNQQGGQMNEMMLKYLKKFAETQEQLAQRINNIEQNGQQSKSPVDQMGEFVKLKQQMEQITDDGGDKDQQIQRLAKAMNTRVKQLEQQFQQAGAGEGEAAAAAGDQMTQFLAAMAQNDEIDNEVVTNLANRAFAKEGDPEVKKKEIDKEIKEMEMQNKQQMIEGAFTGLEGVVDTFAGSAIDSMFNNAGGGQQEEARQPTPVEEAESVEPIGGSDPLGGGGDMMGGGDSLVDEIENEYAEADGGVSMDDEVVPEFEDAEDTEVSE